MRTTTNPASDAVREAIRSWASRISTKVSGDAAARFQRMMLDTWETTFLVRDGGVFAITGDIPAMWLRDSSAQVLPFMRMLDVDDVHTTVEGLVREQWRCIAIDPYANAFNDGPTGGHWDPEDLDLSDDLWERKYEIDSLAFPIRLAYGLWQATGSTTHLTEAVHEGCRRVVDLWELVQDHEARSDYRHVRPSYPPDTLGDDGTGTPVAVTGMTWSGFRPSDDACIFGYNVPAQLMAASALLRVQEMAILWSDMNLVDRAARLRAEVLDGVAKYGVVGQRWAYEVDGLGHQLLMDDANMPSLLSLPLVSDVGVQDERYQRTRDWVLSRANPYFFEGSHASGVGSPHTPEGYVWHIALAVQGLTGDEDEARHCLQTILATDGGTGLTHEGFDPDDPSRFTREWFSWSNSMACELMMRLAAGF